MDFGSLSTGDRWVLVGVRCCRKPGRVDVSSLEQTWAEVVQVHHAAAKEVTLLDRLHHARHHGLAISVVSGSQRSSGTVRELTHRGVVLAEAEGAQSWWAWAEVDAIVGLSHARGHGKVGPDGRWWRGVRRVDVGTRMDVMHGVAVTWVGADHLDLQWGARTLSVPWRAVLWARSRDAWLYEDQE